MARNNSLTPEEKLQKARTKLVLGHPFFAVLAMRLKFIEKNDIDTMATDGRNIYWNRKFVDELDPSDLQGVIAHEALHPGFLHHTRMGSRDPQKWNRAADYAINPIVISAGMTLPDGCLIDQKYAGMNAEYIYTLLDDEDGEGDGGGGWNVGGVIFTNEDGTPLTKEQVAEIEGEWKQAVAQATHVAKMAGKLPAGMDRMVEDLLATQNDWRDMLWSYLTERKPDEFSFNRPNRRFISNGLYLPSMQYVPTGELVVMVDTSGSVGQRELDLFAGEVNGIHHQIKPTQTIVIYCDADVNRVDYFEADDDVKLHLCGGGGTDFRPPFQWLESRGIVPNAAVYLTDGYGPFPNESDVEYPVVWAINNDQVTPPWGRMVRIPGE